MKASQYKVGKVVKPPSAPLLIDHDYINSGWMVLAKLNFPIPNNKQFVISNLILVS